ncbi:MAG TPA: alpha-L-fucosidase [bacterium]|nr:alpha-L-fucosidase [bacterium]
MTIRHSLYTVSLLITVLLFSGVLAQQQQQREYQPTIQSLDRHEVPEWYHDAKLGIFIHWGIYSVPAWAPTTGELGSVEREQWFKYNPYAEWYLNSLRIIGSPTREHHYETYGRDFDYYNFAGTFNKEVQQWEPDEMASVFQDVHARYVVLTSKHHDGFTLWPSHFRNPYLPFDKQQAARDVVGELTGAVRGHGMRMGLYYSGGIDWSFHPVVITGGLDWSKVTPRSDEFKIYARNHWEELISEYQPAILWNDIAYPDRQDAMEIIADYYNQHPEGVINNRWSLSFQDFTTPEYAQYDRLTSQKWEATRGIAYSFGYNQNSGPEQMLTVDELVDMFVDIVSKNGNLLLNVGPKPDGTIPELQVDRLRGLGRWLDVNGEAIFGSRPWVVSAERIDQNVEVRYTQKGDAGYAILLDAPRGNSLTLRTLYLEEGTTISILGGEEDLGWEQEGRDLNIMLPDNLPGEHAYTLKMSPKPFRVVQE